MHKSKLGIGVPRLFWPKFSKILRPKPPYPQLKTYLPLSSSFLFLFNCFSFPGTLVSPFSKIDSQSNPCGCGAVLRGHIRVVFRGRALSRQHSSFGPTSLSCALRKSVYDREKGQLGSQILLLLLLLCSKTICMHSFRKQHRAHSVACELSET